MSINSNKNGGKKTFSCQTNQYHACQWEKCVYNVQSQKEQRLLWESKFVLLHKWTSTLSRLGKKKLFLPNQNNNTIYIKEQNLSMVHNHESDRDYYKNQSLSHLTDEQRFYGKW